MALKKPQSVNECVYFTQRGLGANQEGDAVVWVLRELCPKCKKTLMGKPKDKKGKTLIRAKEYVCPACGYTLEADAYGETLTANIEYTCPFCKYKGEIQIPFKRKKVQMFDEIKMKKKMVESLRFQCEKCKKNIDVTKKMK
jgi:predicted RNA-binding Zn-ribbon protein involved in translation (DUF1610 family)